MYLICWNWIRNAIIWRTLACRRRSWGQRPHEYNPCLYEKGLTECVHYFNHGRHMKANIHEVDSTFWYYSPVPELWAINFCCLQITWPMVFCYVSSTSNIPLMGKLRNLDNDQDYPTVGIWIKSRLTLKPVLLIAFLTAASKHMAEIV